MGDGLRRFKDAQERDYATALAEIRAGQKRSHWMWYVFPQLDGLGFSSTAHYYGIRDLEEARDYLADPTLGGRLREISAALLDLPTNDAHQVFGSPDDIKLRSCMTLFEVASGAGSEGAEVFARVIDKYYAGRRDPRTLALLTSFGSESGKTSK